MRRGSQNRAASARPFQGDPSADLPDSAKGSGLLVSIQGSPFRGCEPVAPEESATPWRHVLCITKCMAGQAAPEIASQGILRIATERCVPTIQALCQAEVPTLPSP